MKRILLSAAAALVAISGFAQSPSNAKLNLEQQMKSVSVPIAMFEARNRATNTQAPIGDFTPVQRSLTETQIGNSYYDLQTNSSVQRRILNHSNGTISATWTFSNNSDWSNRGTGYNYFNGSAWGSIPGNTIESERTGWPNPLATSQGKEIIISHSTASSIMRRVQRNTIGSGTWSQDNLTNQNAQVWGRSAVGGANGNTIHMVGMTLPVANAGTIFNGMDGAFLYTRSSNGGTSWDIVDYQIPGTDSSYWNGFDGDSYAMDAKDNTVVIVVGGLGRGVQLFKSTDNGVNWSMQDVMVSNVWFEESSTFVDTTLADRLWTSDGSVAVLIDDNGMSHVWFGTMFIANPDITDGNINYYPYTNGIEYWTEDFPGTNSLRLIGELDLDGNGQLDLTNSGGQYRFSGLVSHPQAGIDDDGCLYLSYTMVREDLSNGSQNYRHTYVMKSCDNGCSWSFPIDVTGSATNNFVECAFPSIARHVDDEIHIVYMADNEPGIAVSGDMDPSTVNKIIYLKEDVTRFDTVDFCPTEIAGDTFLCIGGSVTLEALGCASSYSWSGPGGFSSSNQVISPTALGTYTCSFSTTCGTQTASVDVVAYSGTGGPTVTIQASTQNMCPGETAVLTANSNVGGVSYLWSNGATTQTISVTATGTYTVTVQDCNAGTTSQSVHISQPANAPQVIITGDLEICSGSQGTLTVIPVSGGSYVWSTGSTTTSTTINAAGTYTCIIQNCAGTTSGSVTVVVEAEPVATIDATVTEACEGEILVVTAGGGSTYSWSNSSTAATLTITTPSESGTYTVTVSNDCGDTDVAEVTLTIFPTPSAPVVSFNGSSYVSSYSTGTHQWYINGSLVGTQTGSTLPGSAVGEGDDVYCIYVDDNGCASSSSNTLVGINDAVGLASTVSVYPNPSNGNFDLRFAEANGNISLTVYNALGQLVYEESLVVKSNMIHSMNLSDLESGVYTLKMNGDQESGTLSIIIE